MNVEGRKRYGFHQHTSAVRGDARNTATSVGKTSKTNQLQSTGNSQLHQKPGLRIMGGSGTSRCLGKGDVHDHLQA